MASARPGRSEPGTGALPAAGRCAAAETRLGRRRRNVADSRLPAGITAQFHAMAAGAETDATELQPKVAPAATAGRAKYQIISTATSRCVVVRRGATKVRVRMKGNGFSRGGTPGGRSSEEVRRPMRPSVGAIRGEPTTRAGAPFAPRTVTWLTAGTRARSRSATAADRGSDTGVAGRPETIRCNSFRPTRSFSRARCPYSRSKSSLFAQYSCVLMRDGHISVLVIEDEADIRQLLRTLLEREGFAVAEADRGPGRGPPVPPEPSRHRHPRRGPPRPGRLAGARADPGHERRAGPHADRPGNRTGQGAGAQRRRRRLPDQAVQPGRAPGPAAGHQPAPGVQRATR